MPTETLNTTVLEPNLFKGSQPVYKSKTTVYETLTPEILVDTTPLQFVSILFSKGFFTDSIMLLADYLPAENLLKFSVSTLSEGSTLSAGRTQKIAVPESFFTLPDGVAPVDPKNDIVTVYDVSGAIIILKVTIPPYTPPREYTTRDYYDFIQADVLPEDRVPASTYASYTLALKLNVQSWYAHTLNMEEGFSIFDDPYYTTINRIPTLPERITGIIPFLTSGFMRGTSLLNMYRDALGDLYLKVAHGIPKATTFGTPVMIGKNIGTVSLPVYTYPPSQFTNVPITRYSFSSDQYPIYSPTGQPSYTTKQSTTSPAPYIVARALDGSFFGFTVYPALLNTLDTSVDSDLVFDFTPEYIRQYTTVGGMGGDATSSVIPPPVSVLPFLHLTGIKVLDVSPALYNHLGCNFALKQRVVLPLDRGGLDNYPILNPNTKFYLSLSAGGSSEVIIDALGFYSGAVGGGDGAEVDISNSGIYTLYGLDDPTQYITITTNRLWYTPKSNSETARTTVSVKSIFSEIKTTNNFLGDTEYRCFAVKNDHPTQVISTLSIWSDLNCNSPTADLGSQQYLAYALVDVRGVINPNPLVSLNPRIASSKIAPEGLTFNIISSESEALVVNNFAPEEVVYIWVMRVLASFNSYDNKLNDDSLLIANSLVYKSVYIPPVSGGGGQY